MKSVSRFSSFIYDDNNRLENTQEQLEFFRTDLGRVHYYHYLSDTFKSQKSRQRVLAHFAKQFGRVYITVPGSQIQ